MHALVPPARFAGVVRVADFHKVGYGIGITGATLGVDRGTIAPFAKLWGIGTIVIISTDGSAGSHIYE